ncbi:MAG TPA: ABC transporter permease [Acidobacteriaceae bacterium]|nr:ABC transporter permease [Acidobacteriaceae bacterium]
MMGRARRLLARVRGVFGAGRGDAARAREIATHLALLEEEFRAKGMNEAEAHRQAWLKLGNATVIREEVRRASGIPFVENLWRDVRYALRQLRKSPGFAATVIGTLALGIGAAAAMFTVVDHVLLQPVPYRNAGRLVQIQEVDASGKEAWPLPWLDIQQWRQQSRSFNEIAFSRDMPGGRNFLVSHGAALQVNAQAVSANLFPTLGVQPMLGRGFLPVAPGFAGNKNAGTIVLSYAVWREALGGQSNILGKTVQIDDTPHTVIGVMPPGFRYPADTKDMAQVWTPIELGKNDQARSVVANGYAVLGRLRPGVTVEAAQAEMAALQKRVAQEWPNAVQRTNHSGVLVQRYSDTLVDTDVRKGAAGAAGSGGRAVADCQRERDESVAGAGHSGSGRWRCARRWARAAGELSGRCWWRGWC